MTAAAGSPRPTSPYDGALALGQFDHVVRVAADLQAGARRLVPHGEPGGQVRRAQDGTLRGERHLALLLIGPGPAERPLQVPAQLNEQGAVLNQGGNVPPAPHPDGRPRAASAGVTLRGAGSSRHRNCSAAYGYQAGRPPE